MESQVSPSTPADSEAALDRDGSTPSPGFCRRKRFGKHLGGASWPLWDSVSLSVKWGRRWSPNALLALAGKVARFLSLCSPRVLQMQACRQTPEPLLCQCLHGAWDTGAARHLPTPQDCPGPPRLRLLQAFRLGAPSSLPLMKTVGGKQPRSCQEPRKWPERVPAPAAAPGSGL